MADTKRLDGRAALITGGGRGIGQAIARAYAAEGAKLALAARTDAELQETAANIREQYNARRHHRPYRRHRPRPGGKRRRSNPGSLTASSMSW